MTVSIKARDTTTVSVRAQVSRDMVSGEPNACWPDTAVAPGTARRKERDAPGVRGDGGRGRRDEGWRRPGLGARRAAPAYLRWRRRSRAVAPASWVSATSPAALADGHNPPRERVLTARRRPCPAPPRSAPAAASAATGRGRRLSSCLPPPRGRGISRTPPLATRSPAARCVCLSDLSVPGGGGP